MTPTHYREIEHREIRGITIRNLIVTVISMISIIGSIIGTYFELKNVISDISIRQEAQNRINEVRLKILEGQVSLLQQEVNEIKNQKINI